MAASFRKPSHQKGAGRMPNSGAPSFASCFGATVPVSPPRKASTSTGQAVLLSGVNYRRLGLDAFEDEDQALEDEEQAVRGQHSEYFMYDDQHLGRGGSVKLGKQYSSFKERVSGKIRSERVYVSEGEQEIGRKGRRLKQGSKTKEQQGDLAAAAESPRRASFGTRVREACVQMLETARRGSPHLSELFVGNQLLMQVTASSSFNARRARGSCTMSPSYGFHAFSNEPSFPAVNLFSSPARSTSASSGL